jgi:hypothetical protein
MLHSCKLHHLLGSSPQHRTSACLHAFLLECCCFYKIRKKLLVATQHSCYTTRSITSNRWQSYTSWTCSSSAPRGVPAHLQAKTSCICSCTTLLDRRCFVATTTGTIWADHLCLACSVPADAIQQACHDEHCLLCCALQVRIWLLETSI